MLGQYPERNGLDPIAVRFFARVDPCISTRPAGTEGRRPWANIAAARKTVPEEPSSAGPIFGQLIGRDSVPVCYLGINALLGGAR
jgi:hypothetical protein